ncbi:MAG: NAD-dependent epimerase/dehydratase family protein [Myxococcales bacterium]|nr:MAG: NAD-dependent epimerase/dehydratase family protein [Myxococcales bacterium]
MSDKILVVGATGFIGANIVHSLLARGVDVRVLLRPTSNTYNIDGLEVERAEGDLTDHPSLLNALEGCDYVFHAAGFYPIYSRPREDEERAMRETRNLLSAAKAKGVKRFVYTSSLSTIGSYGTDGPLADEKAPYHLDGIPSSYYRVKLLMEQEVLAMSPRGLDVVVANPTACFGPGDVKPTTGQIVVDVANRKLPALLDAPINVVDVRDVAESHVALLQKGRRGERYILGGANTTAAQLVSLIAKAAHVKPPAWKAPLWLAEFAAELSEAVNGSVLNRARPGIPRVAIELVKYSQHMNDAKARRELGHASRPLEETVADAVAWFKDLGYIRSRR